MPAANTTKNAAPYRPPCAGWPVPPFFVPRWDHFRASENGLAKYLNKTLVPQYLCDPPVSIPPEAIAACDPGPPPVTNSCSTPCGSPYPTAAAGGACPGGQVCFPGIPGYISNNCFAPSVPAGVVNRAVCHKMGFKNVAAFKYWQGAPGFLDGCPNQFPDAPTNNCQYETFAGATPATRYLTATVAMTQVVNIVAEAGVYSNTEIDTYTYQQTATVDRYTGKVTLSGYVNSVQKVIQTKTGCWDTTSTCVGTIFCTTDETPPGTFEGCALTNSIQIPCGVPGWPGYYATYTGLINATSGPPPLGIPSCPVIFSGPVTALSGNSPYNQNGVLNVTVSETEISYSWVDDAYGPPFTTFTDTITVTLSDPYTSDECEGDCEALLGQFPLNNDAQYPWRTDTAVTTAPLLTYDEASNTATGPLAFLTNDSTWVDTRTNTGAILGKPTPAGYDPFFDVNHPNYSYGVIDDMGNEGWILESFGAFCPPQFPQATQWTDNQQASGLYGGAVSGISGNQGFPFQTLPNTLTGVLPIMNGGCYKQKWAETILFAKPSHNFARPCGPVDAAAVDQTKVTCDTFPSGTLLFPGCPVTCPNPPTAGYQWNDVGLKGDYVTRELTWSSRDVAEFARCQTLISGWPGGCGSAPTLSFLGAPSTIPRGGSALLNIACAQRCAEYANCCPVVICYSPNGEVFTKGLTLPMPRFSALPAGALDFQYGSLWTADVNQWMPDPLWQPPFDGPCVGFTWAPDNGSCLPCYTDPETMAETCYYLTPYEECRCTLPAGAPALPNGLTLAPANPSPGVWTGFLSWQPQLGGGGTPTPWAFWINQLNANCPPGVI